MEFLLITDSMDGPPAENRPAIALAEELEQSGFRVSFLTPCLGGGEIRDFVRRYPVHAWKPSCGYRFPGQATVENVFPEIFIRMFVKDELPRDAVTINFSNQVPIPSTVYYFQGFLAYVTRAFMRYRGRRAIELAMAYVGHPIFKLVDWRWARAMRRSRIIVANSDYSAEQLRRAGLRVDAMLYPPMPRWLIDRYMTQEGGVRSDDEYILVHIGKETHYPTLYRVLRAVRGVYTRARILFFGAKMNRAPRWFVLKTLRLGNADWVREYIPEARVADLYGGAVLTVFTYTEEPFGYVPVESLMAGTPIIAVGPPHQGPHYLANALTKSFGNGSGMAWLPMDASEAAIINAIKSLSGVRHEVREYLAEQHDPKVFANAILDLVGGGHGP